MLIFIVYFCIFCQFVFFMERYFFRKMLISNIIITIFTKLRKSAKRKKAFFAYDKKNYAIKFFKFFI